MKVTEITGVTSKTDIQIQKGISRIIIVKTGTANAIALEKLSVSIKGRSDENLIINRLAIRDVALISQFGLGYMLQSVLADGKVKCAFSVSLSNENCLSLAEQEYISLELRDLESGAKYDVYGFEDLQAQRSFIKYQTDSIPQGDAVSKVYPLGANSVMLAIRNNGSLEKLSLTGNNGVVVTYEPEELAVIARELNGMSVGPDKLVEGDAINQVVSGSSEEFFFLPTLQYRAIELFSNGTQPLTFIKVNNFAY